MENSIPKPPYFRTAPVNALYLSDPSTPLFLFSGFLRYGDFQKLSGCGPEQPTLGVPAGGGVELGGSRGPCQLQPFTDSVILTEKNFKAFLRL